ncbi:hypothetical protein [Alkanindiges illinoisensis]|uniref:HNH endonuclease n=1 Tax=Alkanindiges illinoisensis TaxID=197183 RepID=A0A4Y7XE90_9GAMM|nr:hypothetical protein [Alkanindiges illinoisensis]TEU30081.1 hypothetical protein E2B99_03305 [Alkanindiges illinoisensis]
MRVCNRCGEQRELDQFVRNKNKPDGIHTVCKPCTKIYKAKYYAENKAKILEGFKQKYAENPEKYRELERQRRSENTALYNQRALEYQKRNKDKVNARHREWEGRQRLENIQYLIRNQIRRNLNNALRRNSKNCIATQQLGCSIEFFKNHLERMFKHDMRWDNRGVIWTIDHIEPLSAFDLTNADDLKQACHYTNTQPLYVVENNRKGGANRK